MKATGIVRAIDELGRIVLPVELRRTLSIGVRDSIEIFVDGECVVLKKYQPCCIFCGNVDNVKTFKEKKVCISCREELVK